MRWQVSLVDVLRFVCLSSCSGKLSARAVPPADGLQLSPWGSRLQGPCGLHTTPAADRGAPRPGPRHDRHAGARIDWQLVLLHAVRGEPPPDSRRSRDTAAHVDLQLRPRLRTPRCQAMPAPKPRGPFQCGIDHLAWAVHACRRCGGRFRDGQRRRPGSSSRWAWWPSCRFVLPFGFCFLSQVPPAGAPPQANGPTRELCDIIPCPSLQDSAGAIMCGGLAGMGMWAFGEPISFLVAANACCCALSARSAVQRLQKERECSP